MDRWQTIDTAPKDGTHILACRIPVGIRVTVMSHPPTVVHWFDDGFYTSVNELAPEHPYNPTHWQPLDPLPVPQRQPRYFVGTYTDGPLLWWQVIDRKTHDIVKRFTSKDEAEGYARKLNLRGEDFVFLGSGH